MTLDLKKKLIKYIYKTKIKFDYKKSRKIRINENYYIFKISSKLTIIISI